MKGTFRPSTKVGSCEPSANANKAIPIPVTGRGTICGIYLMFYNGENLVTDLAKVQKALKSVWMYGAKIDGTQIDFIKPGFPAELLYKREGYYSALRGIVPEAEILSYDPSAASGKDEEHRVYRNIGCLDMATMAIDLTFGSDITGVTRVELEIEYDYSLVAKLGLHTRLGWTTMNVPKTGGDIEFDRLPKQNTSFGYEAIHIMEPPKQKIDRLSLTINTDNHVLKDRPVKLLQRLQREADRTPQAGMVSLDFAKEDVIAYNLPGDIQDIKLKPHFVAEATAADATVIVWYEQLFMG